MSQTTKKKDDDNPLDLVGYVLHIILGSRQQKMMVAERELPPQKQTIVVGVLARKFGVRAS